MRKSPKKKPIDGASPTNSLAGMLTPPPATPSPINFSPGIFSRTSPRVENSPTQPSDGTYENLFKQVFDYLKENWVSGKIISITKESDDDDVDNYLYKLEDENGKIYKNVKRNELGFIGGSEGDQILLRKANLKPKMTKTQSNMFDIVLRTLKKVSDDMTFSNNDSIDITPGLLNSLKSLKEKDINNAETVTNNYSEGSKKRMTIPITLSKTSMSETVFEEKYKEIKNEVLTLYKIIKDNEMENGRIQCPINQFFSLAKVGRSNLKDDYLTTIYNDYYSNPEKNRQVVNDDKKFQINERGEKYILPLQLLRTNQFTSKTAKAVREKTYEISKEGERYKEYEKKIFDSVLSFLQGKDDSLMKEWYEKNNMTDEYNRLKGKWKSQYHTLFKHYDKVMKLRELCKSVCSSTPSSSSRKASSPNKRPDLFNNYRDLDDLDNLLFADGAEEDSFYKKAEAIVKGDEELKFWINGSVYNNIEEDYIKYYKTIQEIDDNNDHLKLLCEIYNEDLRIYLQHIFERYIENVSTIVKLIRRFIETWGSTNSGFISRYELFRNFDKTKKILEEELNDDLTKKILKDIDFIGYPKTHKTTRSPSPRRTPQRSPGESSTIPELISPRESPIQSLSPLSPGFLESLGYEFSTNDGKKSPKGKFKASLNANKRDDGNHHKRRSK